ncbi:MAG: protein translocase subunit SecF, partial [Burkholderiaceae bacterium]
FGIYSSIFVMSPMTMWLGIRREDLVKPVKTKEDEVLSP